MTGYFHCFILKLNAPRLSLIGYARALYCESLHITMVKNWLLKQYTYSKKGLRWPITVGIERVIVHEASQGDFELYVSCLYLEHRWRGKREEIVYPFLNGVIFVVSYSFSFLLYLKLT